MEITKTFQSVIESMNEQVYVQDLDMNMLYINPAAERLTGYALNEAMGKKCYEVFGSLHFKCLKDCPVKRVIEENCCIQDHEGELKTRSGEIKIMRVSFSPFHYNGKINGAVVLMKDITEQRCMENRLHEQERLTAKIAETSPAVIYIFDMAEWKNVYANSGLDRLLGFSAEEVQSMGTDLFPRMIHPDDLNAVMAFQEKLMTAADDQILEVEYRMKHKGGQWRMLRSYEQPFHRNLDGSLKEKIGVAIDITENKRVEEALLKEKNFSKAVLDNLPGVFYLMSDQGQFLRWNHALEEVSGYSPDEISIIHPLDFFDHEGKLAIEKALLTAFNEGWATVAAELVAKDGGKTPFLFTGKRFMDHEQCLLVGMGIDITERRLAEAKLQESEKRYRTLFEQSPDAVMVLDPESRKAITFNNRTASLLGYSREEFAQLRIDDYEAVETSLNTRKHIESIMAKGDDIFETIVITRDGRLRNMEVSVRVIEMDNKKLFLSILRDISDEKQIQALTLAERDMAEAWTQADSLGDRLSICLETAVRVALMDSGGIYLMDEADGSLGLSVNQGFSDTFVNRISRFGADSFHARVVRQGIPVYDHIHDMSSMDQHHIAQEDLKVIGIVPLHFGGKALGCLSIASHTTDRVPDHARFAIERISGYIGSFLSREMEVDKRLQIQRNLERLFNTIEDMLFIFDMNGVIVRCNKNVSDRLGYAEDELTGNNILFVHPESRQQEAQAVIDAIMAGQTDVCQIPLQTKDGLLIPVETKVVRGRWQDQDVIFSVSRDITDRLEMERRKQQVEKAESLSRMAGAVAHNFNNMLAAVIGNLEIARDELPQESGIIEYLNEAQQAAQRAAETSRLMLTFLGYSPGNPVLFDLSQSCRNYLFEKRADLPEFISVDTELPVPGPVVKVDPAHMTQVLNILVANAREAMGNISGRMHIATGTALSEDFITGRLFPVEWLKNAGAYACLTVMDNGCGMDEMAIDRIFDPFYTDKFTGRGLGLAVALGIVKSLNGCMTVVSSPGRGSTFRVFFPMSLETVQQGADVGAVEAERDFGGGTVLLVEDQEMVRKLAGTMFKRIGFEVVMAIDGAEAVEIFRKRHDEICLVFSDLTMPRMSGWEMLEKIRHLRPDMPVILSSGYDGAQVMSDDHTEQPQFFLHKPYRFADLKTAVNKAIKRGNEL